MRAVELEVALPPGGIVAMELDAIKLPVGARVRVREDVWRRMAPVHSCFRVHGTHEQATLARGHWEPVEVASAPEKSEVETVAQNRSMADKPKRGKRTF